MPKVRREFVPSVRIINGLEIYFVDKTCVQIKDGNNFVLFHRWFVKAQSYYKYFWKPFCDTLKHSKSLRTIWDAMDIANRYGIQMQSPIKPYKCPEELHKCN